ncbi:39S ribosomal protein L21, mitochondrial [Dendroctonus ponderosae]|uniref:Large ribosomal subunit protein bL21m n=1 Tax=Dendroctonus ponderosae TaxID=77166 RepID=J3JXK1_DENPD|nr:39S ribosomal protein L21, mitochondrial [Dendroctonus ponderosae]AEE62932.1 unknown [Dendroctonus ponderosae]ERL89604.1 hypothetical protein D910_06969 [Dendroctonus ponderosae]KAH1027004.1 hypothetical protein HUJ05_000581 [Dendroctonus ponderosae]
MAKLLPGLLLSNFSKLSLNSLQNAPKLTACANSILSRAKKFSTQHTPYEIVNDDQDYGLANDTIEKVNHQIAEKQQGRLFAVVQVCGKQHKITQGDVLIVEGYWPPECGEKILLNKVLVLGAAEFSLIGRPLVQQGLVNVEATVIEKTLSHTKTHFRKKRRKQYMRTKFFKIPQTFLRINSIKVSPDVNNPPEVQGLNNVIF